MTRDMDLIRRIFLEIEARKDVSLRPIQIDDVDTVILARHLELLLDAKLIEGAKSVSGSGGAPYIRVKDLTWDGHEFIGAIKNDGVWSKLKQALSADQFVSLPLDAVKAVAISIAIAIAKQKAGL